MKSLDHARRVLAIEAQAILDLKDRLGKEFDQAVQLLLKCRGKVVVTGMGKSGQVCRKIAATLSSTGTPAFFLHPAEGIHGDLGMIAKGDVVVAVSNSGETREVIQILPNVKRLDIPLISMTGNCESSLAKSSDVVLDLSVKEEACPMGLAPTASTTVTLAMGDALAVALLEERGFKETDFALLHPGGSLGRRLLWVKDIMKTGDAIPLVEAGTSMKETLIEMTTKRLGVTGVTDAAGKLIGAVTDGDLRRHLGYSENVMKKTALEVMSPSPKTIGDSELIGRAMLLMESHKITSLFIVDKESYPIGVIHLHDLIEAKLA